ncbi:SCP-like protein [Ancylostoma duodenale]|uniref:SCP-like protein n=1 Tax=Ancylostoma duodenale TaxID=51022 RepID=A0A0C2CGN2_9BILA|nr:SCP-like protein [Ancylostoma duodenale]
MKSYFVVLFTVLGIVHANGDYEKCSKNHGIDNEMRERIVETHNGYRSLLAQGLAFMKDGADSLEASKMRSLVYDCEAENSAYESAEKCSTTSSPTSTYDENLYVIEEEDGDVSDPIQEVAWDTRTKVGCAVAKCNSGKATHVVCHYTPKEEAEGKLIYEMGEPCSRCSTYGDFTCEEGLCVTKQK